MESDNHEMSSSSSNSDCGTTKTATMQTIKDRKLVAMRVEKNKRYYNKMEQALGVLLNGKTRKNDLLAYAKKIIAQHGLKLERLMKRSKPVLICWFCEHMNLDPLLSQLIQKQEMVEKYGPAEVFNSSLTPQNMQITNTKIAQEQTYKQDQQLFVPPAPPSSPNDNSQNQTTTTKICQQAEIQDFGFDFEDDDDFKYVIDDDAVIL